MKQIPVTERSLQSVVVDYLRYHGCHVEITDAGSTAKHTRGQVKRGDLPAGNFDLTILFEGKGFKLECKRGEDGIVSRKQFLMKKKLDEMKIPNLIVYSLETLSIWLRLEFPEKKWADVEWQ